MVGCLCRGMWYVAVSRKEWRKKEKRGRRIKRIEREKGEVKKE